MSGARSRFPARRAAFAAPCLAALALGASCSGAAGKLAVLDGNAAFARGERQEALSRYLAAGPGEVQSFDIGNVYAAMGEADAARVLLSPLRGAADLRVAFGAAYNLGLLELELGRHEEAIDSLRAALRLRPGDLEAKRALELAVEAARKSRSASSASRSPSSEGDDPGGNELFGILRELETGRFRAPKPAAGNPAPDDH
ncbi:MAG: hypothetical protein JXA15_02950 [Spirochaetales bacterium]|nr:hypothetical protein [Spirochaetales bacterium]